MFISYFAFFPSMSMAVNLHCQPEYLDNLKMVEAHIGGCVCEDISRDDQQGEPHLNVGEYPHSLFYSSWLPACEKLSCIITSLS